MKKKTNASASWWKIPAFCAAAGWICYELEIRILRRFAAVTLPGGTVTLNETRWMLMSAVLFFLALAVGRVMFRRMSRRALARSAAVMAGIGAVCSLAAGSGPLGVLSWLFLVVSTWCDVLVQGLVRMDVHPWISTLVLLAAPFLFVLFGKRTGRTEG